MEVGGPKRVPTKGIPKMFGSTHPKRNQKKIARFVENGPRRRHELVSNLHGPPKAENASRMSVGKLESPGVFLGNKKTVRSSQFLTGKLETPGAFLSSPKAKTPRKSTVGKLKLPLAFK